DAVRGGFTRPARAGGKRPDGLLDLAARHPLAFEAVQRVRLVGRAEPLRVLDSRNIPLAAAVAELDDETAVVLVHPVGDLAPERDALVAIDGRVVRQDAPAKLDRHERSDDRAHAAARELQLPVDARLVARAVVVVEASGNAGPDDPILDGEVPK